MQDHQGVNAIALPVAVWQADVDALQAEVPVDIHSAGHAGGGDGVHASRDPAAVAQNAVQQDDILHAAPHGSCQRFAQ